MGKRSLWEVENDQGVLTVELRTVAAGVGSLGDSVLTVTLNVTKGKARGPVSMSFHLGNLERVGEVLNLARGFDGAAKMARRHAPRTREFAEPPADAKGV